MAHYKKIMDEKPALKTCRPVTSSRLSLPPIRPEEDAAPGPSRSSPISSGDPRKSDMDSKERELEVRSHSRYHRGCFNTSSPLFMDWCSVKIDKATKKTTPGSHTDGKRLERSHTSSSEEMLNSFEPLKHEKDIALDLGREIAIHVKADGSRVFKLNPNQLNYVLFVHVADGTSCKCCDDNRVEGALANFLIEIAVKKSIVRMKRPLELFDHTILNLAHTSSLEGANNVMYLPILNGIGKTTYLIELCRVRDIFTVKDERSCDKLLKWGSLAIHYSSQYLNKASERDLSEFLLDVIRSMFEKMISLENVIKQILEFAQHLVLADRASLFHVDMKKRELVSTVFDLSYEPNTGNVERREIRIPVDRGIAGHVALSGETLNIPDAYSDSRFNREVDVATGYKTMNILCMPIKVHGRVIGVVQMVNKIGSMHFDQKDEASFEMFSNFFGLALHHAKLYDRIKRKEQKYRVTLEVLSYHNTCREVEVEVILKDLDLVDFPLQDFYLSPYNFNEFQKCQTAIKMFNDLFDMSHFENETVARFILTVKKNYRTVPYHNFDHGWSVANAMYVILKTDDRFRFDYKMRLALFVASLCHDLDHRGYTNKYMSETASPLAAMYTTSTLEHHHFNITATILHQKGHNIFSKMSGEQYRRVLGLIRHCILATDLAAFFPNMAKMKELHVEESSKHFDWRTTSHRELAMAISMTAADLSAAAKPWDIQIRTVQVIFEEFYDQGDKERRAGRTPIPMMNRTMIHEQAASQVGFLSQICVPCYSMMYRILPNTEPMYRMVLKNLQTWKSRAERVLNQSPSTSASTSEPSRPTKDSNNDDVIDFDDPGDIDLDQLRWDDDEEEEDEDDLFAAQ